MISLDAFSELLQVLYATPLYPEQWGHFLDLICQHTGSRTGFLLCAGNCPWLAVQAQGGVRFEAAVIQNYEANYSGKDPFRLPMLRDGKMGLLDCDALVPVEVLLNTDQFRHLNGPAGHRYPTALLLTCSLRRLEVLAIWRSAEEGPMSPEGNRLLELLIPHLQSALEIRQVLGVAQQRVAGAEVMADASPTAAFLLTPRGEIRHCNEAAKSLLRAGDGLMQSNGTLRSADARAREPLRKLLQNASTVGFSQPACFPAQALSLNRISGLRPLQLLVSPVPQERNAGPDVTLLLLVTDPEKPVHLRDDLMRAHYGFTPAETEIANGLLTGYSLEEIAVLRHVTVGTIRYQLKNIFSKTGTSRQSDLVLLLTNLPHPPAEHV